VTGHHCRGDLDRARMLEAQRNGGGSARSIAALCCATGAKVSSNRPAVRGCFATSPLAASLAPQSSNGSGATPASPRLFAFYSQGQRARRVWARPDISH
jgi:hypothetical protein